MLRDFFTIPGTNFSLHSYGLMMVLGFLLGTQLMKFLAKRTGVNGEFFVTAGLVALITGVIGARLSHVLENWHWYTQPERSAWENFVDAINITSGGLTYYGGFLLAIPCTIAYGIWRKLPILHSMDIVAPALMIGLGFGRIGCFLNGCCYGATCDAPWAVHFPYDSNAYVDQVNAGRITPPDELLVATPDGIKPKPLAQIKADTILRQIAAKEESLPVHPAQLYSAFTAFLLVAFLTALFTLKHRQGAIFMIMLVLEGSTRFVLELLRSEPVVAETGWGGMSLSMIISAGLVIAGVIGFFLIRLIPERKDVLTADSPVFDPNVKHHARGLAARV
jgi:phosphatidylglycerol:prolipoprotein diacylglycerol transferase